MPDKARAGHATPPLPVGLEGGSIRAILTHPHPALREIAQPAGYLNGIELAALARDLLATMYGAGGRGLAAPQIGILRRIFVMDAGWKEGTPDPLVMLDPDILLRSEDGAGAAEQCLSIPDTPVEVVRPLRIEMAWYDLAGRRHQRAMSGAAARIAQHEADHLDGRLIVDFL